MHNVNVSLHLYPLPPPQIQLPYEQKAHSDLIMSLSSYD